MIFLDFLGLYFCIVLLNARPMFKSITNIENAGNVGSLNKKYINKEKSIESEVQLFHKYDKKPLLDLDYPRNLYHGNKGRSKRKLESKDMKVKEFEIFKNVQDYQKYSTSDIKNYNTKLSNLPLMENKKLKEVYGYDRTSFLTNEKLLERSNNSARDNIIESSNDGIGFLGTAEIEAVLNDIKHREIQMLTQNEPSVSDLISSTVTETTFSSKDFFGKPKMFTGFSFGTFLPFENDNNTSKYDRQANTANNDKIQHNINVRSIKEDSLTLANSIENMLQKKCKHILNKVKNKLSSDYKEEMNKTRVTVRKELDKLRNKTSGVTNSPQINATSTLPETKSVIKSSLREKHHSRRNRTQNYNISTTLSSHSIPIISDDYSMLLVFELLLTKSHENNVMNMLYTKSFPTKRKISSEKSFIHRNKRKNIKYGLVDNNNKDITFNEPNNPYNVTDDSSYEAISDKIAYNDYVNGYKYYLNYQKNYDDKKYSNLVRYQAHKHHNVDDIGKFILNKIPHLPTARLKRKFVESETLDDQEISTKSEDSWFKKHFFIFLDKDPPQKFHTSETVTFKESNLLVTDKSKQENFTTSKITSFSQQPNLKDNYLNDFDLDSEHMTFDKLLHANYDSKNKRHKRKNKQSIRYRRYLEKGKKLKNYKLNSNTIKVDFEGVDSTPNKLTMKYKKDRIEKRENVIRIPRFKIFKVVKATSKPKYSTRRQKFFDYEVVSDTYIAEPNNIKLKDYFKIEDMIKQVPNISDFNVLYPSLKYTITGNDLLKFGNSRKQFYLNNNPRLDKDYHTRDQSNSVEYTSDDIINVNYKTFDNKNVLTKAYFTTFPTFATMTKDSISADIENLITRFSASNENKKDKDYASEVPIQLKENNKRTMQRSKSPSIVNVVSRNYKDWYSFPQFNSQVTKINNLKHKVSSTKANSDISNRNNVYIPHKDEHIKDTYFRNEYLYKFKPNVKIKSAKFNQCKEKTLVDAITIPDKKRILNHEIKKHNEMIAIKPTIANYVTSNSILDSINNETPDINMYAKNRVNSNKNYVSRNSIDSNIEKNIPDEVFNSSVYQNNFNNEINYFKIKKLKAHNKPEHIYTPPEQYFDTPIPMQVDKFDKFLKKHNIDVASVTAPLSIPVPQSVKSWKSINKVTTMASSRNFNDLQKYCALKRQQDNRPDRFVKKKSTCITNYLYKINASRDPLRFTHMLNNENSLTSTNAPVRNNIRDKVESNMFFGQDIPNRVHMKGHSFKYDIIFHKPYNNWNSDTDTYSGMALSEYKSKNDDHLTLSETLENSQYDQKAKSKVINFKLLNKFNEKRRKKCEKRALQDPPTFTAKDVAALEVVVDLLKSTQRIEDKERAVLESNRNKNFTYAPLFEKDNQLNSIQVHIAIPSAIHDKRRSLESVNVRKVFTAIMSTPVDLEYQIHSFDETTNTPTTVQESILSPGLYLLVENTNVTYPKGNFALKPMNMLGTSNLIIRHITAPTASKMSEAVGDTNISSSNNTIVQNVTSSNEIICKRNVHKIKKYGKTTNIVRNKKRNVNFDGVKRFFGHDRVCHCHCKVNKTMCRTCAESHKVISELMFEFDNLEKYVIDHCTEIQTFFWMNPTDGKKLRDIIHRIDKVLNDYYKRVKGKCQGRTCQMISSNIDKRSFNVDESDCLLTKKMFILLDSLQNVSKHSHKKDNLLPSRKYLNNIHNCPTKEIYKRSYLSDAKKIPMKSIYSLNNIKINLICDTDTSKIIPYSLKNKVNETNTFPTLCDNNDVKKKNKNGLKKFFKMLSMRKKGMTTSLYYNIYGSKNSKALNLNNKKRLATENKIKKNLDSSSNCIHDNNNNKYENNLNIEHEHSRKTNYAKRNIISPKKNDILITTRTREGDSKNKTYRSIKTSITTVKKRFSDLDNNKQIYNKRDLNNTLQNVNKLLNSLSFNNKEKRYKFVKTTTSYNISNSSPLKQIKNNKKSLMNEIKHKLDKLNDDATKSTSTMEKKLLQSTTTLRTKDVIKTNNSKIKVTSKFNILNKLKNISFKYTKSKNKKSNINLKSTESHLNSNTQNGKLTTIKHKNTNSLQEKTDGKVRKECFSTTTSTNPAIIIFEDIALTDSNLYSTNSYEIIKRDEDPSLNNKQSDKSLTSYIVKDVDLNRFIHQTNSQITTDCINSKLNVSSSSILSTANGFVRRIADKFAVEFVPNKKENTITAGSKTINTDMVKLNQVASKNKCKSNKNVHKQNPSQLSISVSTSPTVSPVISVTTKTVRITANRKIGNYRSTSDKKVIM